LWATNSCFLVLLVLFAVSNLTFFQVTKSSSSGTSENKPLATLASKSRNLFHKINDHGLSFQAMMVYDWSKALDDGQDSGSGFGRYSIDLSMPVDGKKLLGFPGSSGLVRLKHHMRHFGELYDGAAQLYSNIDADSRTTLYEVWIEQKLWSDKFRLKAGKIDANTEFAAVQAAGDFLNSSMGYSPTIMAFPTYPEPKLGINAFVHPKANYRVGLGIFQTAGMGTLSILEPGHNWSMGRSEHPGRGSFGYWHLDGKLARFDQSQAAGTQGFYSVVEQSVWRQPLGQEGERLISIFLQAGWAEGRLSPFTHHLGGGAVLQGPLRKRSHDGIGMAATWVRFSSQPAAGFDLPSELTLETYYKMAIMRYVALVSDFQYLHNPGGLRTNPDCPVVTSRLVISF
jgi:porin